jgi:outer membrane lipoprotein-sorting protein
VEEKGRWRYVLAVFDPTAEGQWTLRWKLWLDPANLELARLQIYDPQGSFSEDIRYSDYRDFEGIRYPRRIQIDRPFENYRLVINILKATFNQPIAPEKFELKKPEKARLVDLRATTQAEDLRGQ